MSGAAAFGVTSSLAGVTAATAGAYPNLTADGNTCRGGSVPAFGVELSRSDRELATLNCSTSLDLECAISYWLYAVSVPLMLLVGTVGNVLTMIVMATRSMRKTAFGIYIAAIAATDTLVLWTAMPRHFIRWIWLVDIRQLDQWSCRILRFLQFSLMNTSAWLLVIVTAERFLTIHFPTRFRFYKKRSRALRVVAAVSSLHFAWNVHIFWTLGEPSRSAHCSAATTRCGYTTVEAEYYWRNVHLWLDLVKLSVLPFVLMLAMNVAIVASLQKRAPPPPDRGDGKERSLRFCGSGFFACGSAKRFKGRNLTTSSESKTAMLLWVSFFYVFTTVPTFVSTAYDNAKQGTPLLASIATLALYANNSANFILYSLSGPTFRRLFCAVIFRSKSKSRVLETAATQATSSADVPENGSRCQGD